MNYLSTKGNIGTLSVPARREFKERRGETQKKKKNLGPHPPDQKSWKFIISELIIMLGLYTYSYMYPANNVTSF